MPPPGFREMLASTGGRDAPPLILVVEDDVANRTLLEELLHRDGYRTVSVANGEAGLRAVAEHAPDLVLLDIGLPLLDGFEVTRRLRIDLRTATLPVILLTGRTSVSDVVAGLDAGADDFLSKPFQQPELLARIRSVLRMRQALERMSAAQAAVAALAARVGARVALDEADLEAVAYGALLHDVGKIGVPESILTKPGPLDVAEWALMRRHPEMGERICAPLNPARPFTPIVRHPHERWD